MLPKLDPGVRVAPVFRNETQWRTICQRRQHRTGSKIETQADDVSRIDPSLLQDRRDGNLEDAQIIFGVLQCPIRLETYRAAVQGQKFIDDPVGITIDGCRQLGSIGDIHQDCAAGLGTKVNANRIFFSAHLFLLRIGLDYDF